MASRSAREQVCRQFSESWSWIGTRVARIALFFAYEEPWWFVVTTRNSVTCLCSTTVLDEEARGPSVLLCWHTLHAAAHSQRHENSELHHHPEPEDNLEEVLRRPRLADFYHGSQAPVRGSISPRPEGGRSLPMVLVTRRSAKASLQRLSGLLYRHSPPRNGGQPAPGTVKHGH